MIITEQIRILESLINAFDHLAEYAEQSTLSEDVSPHLSYIQDRVEAKGMLDVLVAIRDKPEEFRWTRLKSSMNGNPRHKTLLDYFCTKEELQIMAHSINRVAYDQAVKDATDRVRALGGRMTASGPVVSSYNRSDFVRRVGEIVGRKYVSVE